MEKVTVELECAKETLELGQGLEKLVDAVREAMKDGWQTSQDLPMIVMAAVKDLGPAVQGLDQLSEEAKSAPEFANALYASLSKIVFKWVK